MSGVVHIRSLYDRMYPQSFTDPNSVGCIETPFELLERYPNTCLKALLAL